MTFSTSLASTPNTSNTYQQAQKLLKNAPDDFASRLTYFSEKLLGTRYVFRSFGEGPSGEIQTAPLYHFNSFDCINYIEIVLALSHSKSITELDDQIIKVRYRNNLATFNNRNHFSEIDWIPENIKNGNLKDITREIAKENTALLTSTIDRKSWMQNLQPAQLQPSRFSESETIKNLAKISESEKQHVFSLNYIPKRFLIENFKLVNEIPNGTIVHFLALPFASDTQLYKSQIFVYHAGFLIKNENSIVLRSASSQKAFRRVVDIDFKDYILEANKNDNFLGIHLLQPVPNGQERSK